MTTAANGGLLADRVALVTGSSRGIGRAIAIALARAGASVCLSGRSADALERVADEVRADGGTVAAVLVHDLYRADGVDGLLAELSGRVGPIDILVNNAGVGSRENLRPVVDFDIAFWDATMSLNLRVPFLLSRASVPSMIARGFGRVINVASINARVPSVSSAAYVASKHGLIGFTRVLALEVAGTGVTANAVCPGVVDVGDDRRLVFDAQRAGVPVDVFEQRLTPMGGRLKPEDIAPTVVFLAGEGAATITGQAINIDKGAVMS
jgi:NAD(P)-dependent dehydrogenase (short-subunit alcohol dehydrogenase family)